ncbi:putative zinc-finger [Promicromonospora umidemergens]|uniref:Putative zinc-finger domain-containing protein n=1 Tax=Promicromonospora umidemergens TaxID=629679 RepID=A0ABP8XA63_9MICO|nr:zf-HC2 domain-containing protein [Promicromonospora umidemergens]MCP2281517.1 putative zinc-finger [Promicromonospora umidemergens]
MTTGRCAALRDALTEVALGVADGTTRGTVLAHLATCERCRDDLASLAAAADELLLLVPEREPSAGFEGRVLARLTSDGSARPAGSPALADGRVPPVGPAALRRHRARTAVLAGALGVGLLGVGGTGVWVATEPDRDLAAAYRTTLDTADGRYLAAADLTTDGESGGPARPVGTVFLYEGNPSWAYVVVRDGTAPSYTVTVTVATGTAADDGAGAAPGTREVTLGSCVVDAGTCSAGGVLDVAVHGVVTIRLTAPDGETWATAAPRTPS